MSKIVSTARRQHQRQPSPATQDDILLEEYGGYLMTIDETWENATRAIVEVARSDLGTTKPGRRKIYRQAWLWTHEVKTKMREKKRLYHVFLE
ncbi:hypothetical protein Y032_0021g357 [Ancylostoma ceylanicum]|uniref:Uncharacterized protein n=1 Tax=Ancylostoma ceylanicum TaxID=53326 RepID=A0A016V095_9BILA|nr:hypothetical protein Y032_0021g357 [Ancylostoma ceylanicum]